jgi:hypothetical protein
MIYGRKKKMFHYSRVCRDNLSTVKRTAFATQPSINSARLTP